MRAVPALVQIASGLLGVVLGSLATSSCSDEAAVCEPAPPLQQGTFPVVAIDVESEGPPPVIDAEGASLTISAEDGVILDYLREGLPARATFRVVVRHGMTEP